MEQPVDDVHPLPVQPDRVVVVGEWSSGAARQSMPSGAKAAALRSSRPRGWDTAVGSHRRHERSRTGGYGALQADAVGQLDHRVDVGQLVPGHEVGDERRLLHRLVQHGIVEAAEVAAHVQLDQLEAVGVLVQVGAGHPAGHHTAAADHHRNLRANQPDCARTGLDVAAEEPARHLQDR